eukprot:5286289-Prymnesium_polylepis.1
MAARAETHVCRARRRLLLGAYIRRVKLAAAGRRGRPASGCRPSTGPQHPDVTRSGSGASDKSSSRCPGPPFSQATAPPGRSHCEEQTRSASTRSAGRCAALAGLFRVLRL